MKLGPVEIRRYAQTKEKVPTPETRPRNREVGATGTPIFSGLAGTIAEEYNQDLIGDAGLRVWDQMFRSDPTVRAVEKTITLPIRAANLTAVPASDKTEDVEIAQYVEDNWYGMKMTADDTLRHILYFARYGRYLMERVWELRSDGKYWTEKLAPRRPHTVHRWFFTEDGGFAGIEQRTWKLLPDKAGFNVIATGEYKFIPIEADRLLLFVHEGEGSNFEGESIARPMYKPWYIKDGLERILSIGAERREVGVEMATMREDATLAQMDSVVDVLASLHAQSQGYAVMPPTVEKAEVFGLGQGRTNTIAFLEYVKREIALAGLADFLAIGEGGLGAGGVHRDKTSFFMMNLKALAEIPLDVLNRFWVKQLVDINFGPRDGHDAYPKLEFSRLETRNVAEFADAVSKLATAGFLTPDGVTQAAMRAELDLPEKPEEDAEIEEERRRNPPPLPGQGPAGPGQEDDKEGEPGEDEGDDDNPNRQLRMKHQNRTRTWRGTALAPKATGNGWVSW